MLGECFYCLANYEQNFRRERHDRAAAVSNAVGLLKSVGPVSSRVFRRVNASAWNRTRLNFETKS